MRRKDGRKLGRMRRQLLVLMNDSISSFKTSACWMLDEYAFDLPIRMFAANERLKRIVVIVQERLGRGSL